MQDAPKQKGCSKVQDSFRGLDYFATGFRFNTGGKKVLDTTFGAIISVLMCLILLMYGSMQLQRLIEFNETVVT